MGRGRLPHDLAVVEHSADGVRQVWRAQGVAVGVGDVEHHLDQDPCLDEHAADDRQPVQHVGAVLVGGQPAAQPTPDRDVMGHLGDGERHEFHAEGARQQHCEQHPQGRLRRERRAQDHRQQDDHRDQRANPRALPRNVEVGDQHRQREDEQREPQRPRGPHLETGHQLDHVPGGAVSGLPVDLLVIERVDAAEVLQQQRQVHREERDDGGHQERHRLAPSATQPGGDEHGQDDRDGHRASAGCQAQHDAGLDGAPSGQLNQADGGDGDGHQVPTDQAGGQHDGRGRQQQRIPGLPAGPAAAQPYEAGHEEQEAGEQPQRGDAEEGGAGLDLLPEGGAAANRGVEDGRRGLAGDEDRRCDERREQHALGAQR